MRKARLLQKGCKVKLHTRGGYGGVLQGFTPAAQNYATKWMRKAGVEITTALPDNDSFCIRCTGNVPSTPEPCFKPFHTWTSSVVRVEGLSAIDAMTAGRMAAEDVLSMANARLRSQSNEKRGKFVVRQIKSDVKVAVISLGDHNAILCAGPLTLTGVLPAILKRFVQVINVHGARGNVFAAWAARQSSALALWLGRLATRMERAAPRQSIALSHSQQ